MYADFHTVAPVVYAHLTVGNFECQGNSNNGTGWHVPDAV